MSFYTVTGAPGTRSFGSSAAIRAEFQAIATAFGVFPTLAGNSGKVMVVNPGETGFEFQTAVTYLTQTVADARYLALAGGTLTGPLLGLMDGVGARARPLTAAAVAGFAVDDVGAARRLELLYLGAGNAGLYGAAGGSAVINASSALTVSVNDAARLVFDTNGHATLTAQLILAGGEAFTGGYGLRLLNSTATGGGEVTALAGAGAGLKIGADAGPLALWAGGAQRLWIDTVGGVGVGAGMIPSGSASGLSVNGTSNVNYVLGIAGAAAGHLYADTGQVQLAALGSHQFVLAVGGAVRQHVNASGETMFGDLSFAGSSGALVNVNGGIFTSLTTNSVTGLFSASAPTDAFTVDTNKTLHNYGLAWKQFSDALAGPSAALSGYGGIRLYTAAAEQARLDNSGNLMVGTTTRSGVGAGTDRFAVNGTLGFTTQANGYGASFVDLVNRCAGGGLRLYTNAGAVTALSISSAGVLTDLNGNELGYKVIPKNTALADGATFTTAQRGQCASGGYSSLTVPSGVFAAGDSFAIYVDGTGAMTLIQGSGLTMRLAGTTTLGSRTIAARGFATVWFNGAGECIVSGAGVS